MASITFSITSGQPPFIATLSGHGSHMQLCVSTGTFVFAGVSAGSWLLRVEDSMLCRDEVVVDVGGVEADGAIQFAIAPTASVAAYVDINVPEVIPRGQAKKYNKQKLFKDYIVQVNNESGVMVMPVSTGPVPLRVEVSVAGTPVFDSGYRGNKSYQEALDVALAQNYLPSAEIDPTLDFVGVFATDGTDPYVRITSPLSFASCNWNTSAPSLTEYAASFNSHICIQQ